MFGRKKFIVHEFERGLLYLNGQFKQLLTAGQYKYRKVLNPRVDLVDTRLVSQTVEGQEVLTNDKIGVRVTLIAQYQVVDPVLAKHAVDSYQTHLYQELQLSLREAITTKTLEEVLKDRDVLAKGLLDQVAPGTASYGVKLQRVGVKDVILPGVVREVFLQEVQADLKGRASLVTARHEHAAARARANTAKLLQENPHIQRMQELDALLQLASKAGNMVIIPGLDSLLAKLTTKTGE